MHTVSLSFFLKTSALLSAVVFFSCSKAVTPEENPFVPDDNHYVTLTTSVSLSADNAGTRTTMTDNGDGTISTAWEVGDPVWVNYTNTSEENVEAQATVTAVDGSGKATISVVLTNPKDNSDILFGFPYNHWHEGLDPHENQVGTLEDIKTNHAASSGGGTLSVSGDTATLPTGVAMTPEMCIWKFSFSDGTSDITADITNLSVSFGEYDEYLVTPTGLSHIYVAIYGDPSPRDITITATTSEGHFSMARKGITIVSGMMYTTNGLKLSPPVFMGNATANEVGKTLASDRYIYVNARAAKASGSQACAVVAYVGDATGEPNYTHGLAISMRNIAGNGEVWKNTYGTQDNPGQYNLIADALEAKESGFSLTYPRRWESNNWTAFFYGYWNNIEVDDYVGRGSPSSTSGWFLPSIYQWNKVVNGLTDTEADLTLWDNAALSLFEANEKLESQGADGFRYGAYWSSSEHSDNNAWLYWANYGKASDQTKNRHYYIRSVLAF